MMLAASLTLCLLARLPLRFVFSRLKYPLVFVLLLALALPFVYGETVLVSLGSFSVYREGSLELLKTTAKMASILAVGLVFLGTTTQARTFETMRALGMPASLANMMLACCLYLSEIGGTLTKLRRAARIESPEATRPDSRMLLTIASITRSTLVRSYKRSRRSYQEMVLRGYGSERGQSGRYPDFELNYRDVGALWITLLAIACFIVADIIYYE